MDCVPYNIKAPALPLAPLEYDQQQQDQFQYALRLYFNRLDNYLAQLSACINMSGTITDPTYVAFGGATVDAFGRLRTSSPFTLFDSQNRYQKDPQFSETK